MSTITPVNMTESISEKDHALQEIAAIFSGFRPSDQLTFYCPLTLERVQMSANTANPLLPKARRLYRHRDLQFSEQAKYEVMSGTELVIHEVKPGFYQPLRVALQDVPEEQNGIQKCIEWLQEALTLYNYTPLRNIEIENLIINISERGKTSGMSAATEKCLLDKTWIANFEDQSVEQENMMNKFIELVLNDQFHTVAFILGKLSQRKRRCLAEKCTSHSPSTEISSTFHSFLSSYVLSNDTMKGKIHAIICINECGENIAREVQEQADTMHRAMEDAKLEVEKVPYKTATELSNLVKKFAKKAKDQCSAAFAYVMHNDKRRNHLINQTLQALETELPLFLPKIVIEEAYGECSRRPSHTSYGAGSRLNPNLVSGEQRESEQIQLTPPETILLMHTTPQFIRTLAEYLSKPDGKTSLHEMFTKAITTFQMQQGFAMEQMPVFVSTAANIIMPKPLLR